MKKMIHIATVSQLHQQLSLPGPTHPLVSIFHQSQLAQVIEQGTRFSFDLYMVSLKDGHNCSIGYGKTTYDFDDGTMTFLAPQQEITIDATAPSTSDLGWTMAFHPDLIKRVELGNKIEQYTFFNYESHEALHLSEREILMVTDIVKNIDHECLMTMDGHTHNLICSNIDLLLKYCSRFYDRQFYVRTNLNRDHINRFNEFLHTYYQSDKPLTDGIPSVQYCGHELGLSPYYLSDLLKRETGKNALEHIHLLLIEKAKVKMSSTNNSITQIAYDLGFEYPQHFSKLFKSKTGMTPREYRTNN